MMLSQLQFEKVNKFIPFILVLGVGLGVADYSMGSNQNVFQLILLHIVTTFIIGYALLVIVNNQDVLLSFCQASWQRYLLMVLLFMVVGLFATELELLMRSKVLANMEYVPFSGDSIYLSNAIITALIGIGTLFSLGALEAGTTESEQQGPEKNEESDIVEERGQELNVIPSKQGENVHLIPLEDILYFESYDNYSFVITSDGQKQLCDFNLKFLESRLGNDFFRVHRKYIANKAQIKAIKPHLNSRYILELKGDANMTITSSKGYASEIKSLMKIP